MCHEHIAGHRHCVYVLYSLPYHQSVFFDLDFDADDPYAVARELALPP